jgi:hypothetical protein
MAQTVAARREYRSAATRVQYRLIAQQLGC